MHACMDAHIHTHTHTHTHTQSDTYSADAHTHAHMHTKHTADADTGIGQAQKAPLWAVTCGSVRARAWESATSANMAGKAGSNPRKLLEYTMGAMVIRLRATSSRN